MRHEFYSGDSCLSLELHQNPSGFRKGAKKDNILEVFLHDFCPAFEPVELGQER